ncbi:unnamed protein product [Withania somnifera]
MASSKSYISRSNYRFLTNDRNISVTSDSIFELDESDLWNSPSPSPGTENSSPSPDFRKKRDRRTPTVVTVAASVPVNVPDWSTILKDEYRDNRRRDTDYEDCDDDDDVENRIPPHEFLARQLARTRIASFSVHEGIGRTLKGRDLSRVRNAIFEKTGFED